MSKAHETLILYKRHTESCAVHKTRIPPNRRRYWMSCDCIIWMVGQTETQVYPRQSTHLTKVEEAIVYRDGLLNTAKVEKVHGPKLSECIEKFLESKEGELSKGSLSQYRLLFRRLQRYCDMHKVEFMNDLTVDVLETFKTRGLRSLVKSSSRATSVSKLRCFLREGFRRDWIAESLAQKVRPVIAVVEVTEPYTDDEVERILTGCLCVREVSRGYGKFPNTFRLLLDLMLETGLRVSDAVRFDPALLRKGEYYWVYTYVPEKTKQKSKTARHFEAFISERLKEAIDRCDWFSPQRPFAYGPVEKYSRLTQLVYNQMQAIGRIVGVDDCRPHKLRHTFAVRLLIRGMELDDVSRLLSHSSVMITEKFYSKWVKRRALRLEKVFADSFGAR